MGWQDDLLDLLTAPDEDPVEDILRSAPGQAGIAALTSAPADVAFRALDLPASVVRGTLGSATNVLGGQGTEGVGLEQGQRAWDLGMQGLRTSDRFPGLLKGPVELAANIAVDPLTYTGIGAAGRGARALETAANQAMIRGASRTATGLRAGAKGLELAQAANDLPARVVLPPVQAGVRRIGGAVERVLPTALQESARSRSMRRSADLHDVATAMSKPPPANPAPLSIGSITSSSTPPVLPDFHPTGSAPSRIKQIGADAWRRIRLEIPASADGGMWATPDQVRLSEAHLDDMAAIGANTMLQVTEQGGLYTSLERASGGMQQLQAQIVGKYGAGIQPYLPMIYDRMRRDLGDQADLLMPSARFLLPWGWAPGVVGTRRLREVNDMVRTGELTREQGLERITSELPGRKTTPQVVEGAAAMGSAFLSVLHNADDDIYHEFRPGGAWFPQRVTGDAKAAVPSSFIDELWGVGDDSPRLKMDPNSNLVHRLVGVDQPFGSTREAWNHYMRQQFGQGLQDDELDHLARMATDLTYDTYVNSANDISGGAQGAARIAEAGLTPEGEINLDPFRETFKDFVYSKTDPNKILHRPGELGKVGEKFSKRGVIAREDADVGSDYAQRIIQQADAEGRLEFDAKNGRAKTLSVWKAQAHDILGREATPEDLRAVNPRLGKDSVTDKGLAQFLLHNGVEPIRMENPVGGLLPNLSKLVDIIQRGAPLYVSPLSKNAADWYGSAAKEIVSIVGAGNYEKASVLLDMIAVTSAGTEVSSNARFALRALAEWDYGYDDTLRTHFGLTGTEFDRIRKANLLHADMAESHRTKIEQAATEYQSRRDVPGRLPEAVAGGTKTFNYGGSFLVNIWRDMIDRSTIAGGPAMKGAREAFDKALELFTVDRHQSRVENLATAVNEIEEFMLRERGMMATKLVAGEGEDAISGEAAQAAMWYWSRDKQGFARMMRPDSDIVYSLRKTIEDTWNAVKDTPTELRGRGRTFDVTGQEWESVVSRVSQELGLSHEEAVAEVYNMARQDMFLRLIHASLQETKVADGLRAVGITPTIPGLQAETLGVIQRGAHGIAPDEVSLLRAEMTGTPTPAQRRSSRMSREIGKKIRYTDDQARFQSQLRQQLDDLGLADIDLAVVNKITDIIPMAHGDRARGVYMEATDEDGLLRLIGVSLDNTKDIFGLSNLQQARSTLDHEAVHAMKSLGLFTDDEWKTLVDAAKAAKPTVAFSDAAGGTAGFENLETLVRTTYRGSPEDVIEEELAARLFQYWRTVGHLPGWQRAETFMQRMLSFMTAIANALRGTYPEEVLQRMASGEIGRRAGPEWRQMGLEMRKAADPAADRARQAAALASELDISDTTSIYQRKVKQPVMEHYARFSLQQAATSSGMSLDDLNLPDWPDRMAAKAKGFDPRLTLQQNELLQTKLSDGRTYRDVWTKTAGEAHLDMKALKDAGVSWGPYATKEERKAAAGGDAALEKIIAKWTDDGIDIAHASDPNQVAAARIAKLSDKEAGVDPTRRTGWDLFRAAWGEQALLSGKYHTGNLLGGWTQNMIAGHPAWPPLRDVYSAFKGIRGGTDEVTRQEALASMHATKVAQFWGLDAPPTEIMRGGVRALTMGSSDYGPSAVGEVVGRLTRNPKLGRKAGWIFQANNDMGLAVDTGVRGSVWEQTLDDEMWRMLPAWETEVRQRGSAIPGFAFDVKAGTNAPPSFQADALKAHLMDLGFQDGVAEHLMRKFVEVRGLGLKTAKAELDRVQFYGSRTNLDEWIAKVIPFHYWFSRALRFYGEEAVRHPFLLLNYMRLSDGIEDAQNDPGLSARQKGFLRLFGTPIGFSLLMNPDALFGVVRVFGMDQYEREQGGDKWSDPPSGMTPLGGALDWVKQRGFGIYPWIDGTLNLMGVYGNDFEPDLLGIRHKAIVGAAVNFVRSQLGWDPAGTPYSSAMGQARWAVSSFVSSIGPDWLAQPVTPRAGGSSQEAALDTLIESVIMEDNPGLTNGDLLEVMSDPDSPEYDAAYKKVAAAGITQQLLNFTAPVQFRLRNDATDVRRSQVEVVSEEARKQGVAPYEIAATPQDLAFQAKYKALTGKDFVAGDYEDAKLKHDLARAPTEAKPFLLAEADYNNLGTPEQQRIYQGYSDLLNGDDERTKGLSEDGRREVANQYLFRTRGAGKAVDAVRALRSAYVDSHPEFAEFKSWQGRMFQVRDAFGSLAEYRRQASQQNPNAARYFADQWDWITKTFPEAEWDAQFERSTTNANAFLAITGQPQLRSIQGPIPGVPKADITIPNIEQQAANLPGAGGYNWANELAGMGQGIGVQTRWGF